ncbi:hypothetical protein [Nostoc sp.]|uniref:hypothetical protein n=1 Tax=Nostoc sp. TaxID=1180 RepID=UPI002FF925F2
MSGQHPQLLKQWVLDPPSQTVEIHVPRQYADEPAVGRGFDVELGKFWFNPETNKLVRWHERYLVVYSYSLANTLINGQQQRLNLAQAALDKLAAQPGDDIEHLNSKVEAIVKRYRVSEFFSVTATEEILTQTRYAGRDRPTAKSHVQQVTRIHLQLQFQPQCAAIETAKQLAGWRLYVTNAPIPFCSGHKKMVYQFV